MRNVPKPWTRKEEEELRGLILSGKSVKAIAMKLGRTPPSIERPNHSRLGVGVMERSSPETSPAQSAGSLFHWGHIYSPLRLRDVRVREPAADRHPRDLEDVAIWDGR